MTVPTNPHWVRVVEYGPFPLCVIQKEGLCPSSVDINRLMMITVLAFEELDGPVGRALGVRSQKLSNVCEGQSSDG
jgi:hypothetical protein